MSYRNRRAVRPLVLLALLALLAGACGRSEDDAERDAGPATTAAGGDEACAEELEATEVGITADSITIEVAADIGSPIAPGLFQGNVDGIQGFADWINERGGLACRDLVVKVWDTKLNPQESKNGQIEACRTAFAMVGSNALFNPDTSEMVGCEDKAGEPTGLPDLAALAGDPQQQCSETTFVIQPVVYCPLGTGVRTFRVAVGMYRYLTEELGPLHGGFASGGDLPLLLHGSNVQTAALAELGVEVDEFLRVSPRDEQSAQTPRIQRLKAAKANWVHNNANDRALVSLRKEANAQGLTGVEAWTCTLGCYTKAFLETGGADVEGTYVYMDQLPFEERDQNEHLDAFLTELGDKADSFAANSWQAGLAFKEAVERAVEKHGVNGLTRKALLTELENFGDFDADGWIGTKGLKDVSPCFVLLQVQDGEYARVHPTEPGTFDCDEQNLVTVEVDPTAGIEKWT